MLKTIYLVYLLLSEVQSALFDCTGQLLLQGQPNRLRFIIPYDSTVATGTLTPLQTDYSYYMENKNPQNCPVSACSIFDRLGSKPANIRLDIQEIPQSNWQMNAKQTSTLGWTENIYYTCYMGVFESELYVGAIFQNYRFSDTFAYYENYSGTNQFPTNYGYNNNLNIASQAAFGFGSFSGPFVAEFKGKFEILLPGIYTFEWQYADDISIFVDQESLTNTWDSSQTVLSPATKQLVTGTHSLRVRYRFNTGTTSSHLVLGYRGLDTISATSYQFFQTTVHYLSTQHITFKQLDQAQTLLCKTAAFLLIGTKFDYTIHFDSSSQDKEIMADQDEMFQTNQHECPETNCWLSIPSGQGPTIRVFQGAKSKVCPGVQNEGTLCSPNCQNPGYCDFCGTGKCCKLSDVGASNSQCKTGEVSQIKSQCVPSKACTSFQLIAYQNLPEGYTFKVFLSCSNSILINPKLQTIFTPIITITQLPKCKLELVVQDLESKTKSFKQSQITPQIIIYSEVGQLFQQNQGFTTTCTMSSCKLMASDCIQDFGKPDLLQMTEQMVLSAAQNKQGGYSVSYCIKCTIIDKLQTPNSYDFLQSVLQVVQDTQCETAITTKAESGIQIISPYKQNGILEIVKNLKSDIFDVSDVEDCYINKCEVMKEDCQEIFNTDLIIISQQFKLNAKIDQKGIYTLSFCIKCSNDFMSKSVPGFKVTQTPNCEEYLTKISTSEILQVYKFDEFIQKNFQKLSLDKFFKNEYEQYCPITSCRVVNNQTNSQSIYVSYVDSFLLSQGNVISGYTENLVLQCSIKELVIVSESFRISQSRDCSSSLKKIQVKPIEIRYSEKPSIIEILRDYRDIFQHYNENECLFKNCQLNDCNGGDIPEDKIQIDANTGKISAYTNIAGGYFTSICLSCSVQNDILFQSSSIVDDANSDIFSSNEIEVKLFKKHHPKSTANNFSVTQNISKTDSEILKQTKLKTNQNKTPEYQRQDTKVTFVDEPTKNLTFIKENEKEEFLQNQIEIQVEKNISVLKTTMDYETLNQKE